MLDVENLEAAYGESQVLFGVSLEIQEGEFVAMIGPNGAGKTTLFRTLSGSLNPTAGTITYQGTSLVGQSPHRIARLGISHVPQEHNIFTELTVLENLKVSSYMAEARTRREQNLELVFEIFPRLKERQQQIGGTLSGGEQQMLALAKGLMSDPELLLLDEPSSGLAPNLVEEIFERILDIREETGVTVFLVEQRVLETLEVAERAYVLENGSIELRGPTEDLMENPRIQESYLGIGS